MYKGKIEATYAGKEYKGTIKFSHKIDNFTVCIGWGIFCKEFEGTINETDNAETFTGMFNIPTEKVSGNINGTIAGKEFNGSFSSNGLSADFKTTRR